MDRALATVDESERAFRYQIIQALSANDVPWIPLWSNKQQTYIVAQKGVQGIVPDLTMDLHIDLLYKE